LRQATASTNEFAEVVLGGSIAIPAAAAFFGVVAAQNIAASGAFNLGFVSMPAALSQMPLGFLFGFFWFGLLFFAGITSSVALTQPTIAFLEDEFGWDRKKAAYTVGIVIFITAQIPIFLRGALDELDFWMGTFFITFFALIEAVLFAWVYGMDKGWEEMHKGAQMKVPRIFYPVMKYVTPIMLILIIGGWLFTEWIPTIMRSGTTIWITRAFIVIVLLFGVYLVEKAFRKNPV
jgi:SNF family Na+-dependent transporter